MSGLDEKITVCLWSRFVALSKTLLVHAIICPVVFAEEFTEAPSTEYRVLVQAIGAENYHRADSLMRHLFAQPEIFPEIFETGPLLFVYQNRIAAGLAFFDSLRAREQYTGDVLGALAILQHHARKNEESLQYLQQALTQGCRALRPYELFVTLSFETKTDTTAMQFLLELAARTPDNWRYRFALAQWYSAARQPEETCKILNRLLEEGHKHWRLYYALGGNLSYLGRKQEALTRYEEGRQNCEAQGDDDGALRMWYGIATNQFALGKAEKAKDALQRAETLARQTGAQIFSCRLHLLAGEFLTNEQQWLAAHERLTLAREQAVRFAEGNALLHSYYKLMNLNRVIGKWDEAVECTLKSADVADSLGLTAYSLDLRSIIGTIDLEAGRYEQALLRQQQLEETARSRGVLLHRIPYLLSLGKAYVALERYEEAEPPIIEGMPLVLASGSVSPILDFQKYLSTVWLHTGRPQRALALLHEARTVARKSGLKLETLDVELALAEAYLHEGQVDTAQKILLEILKALPPTPPYRSYLEITSTLAETYVRQAKLNRAIAIYDAALELIATQTHINSPGSLSALSKEERAIYFGLSRAYLRVGEKEKALAVTESADDLVVRRKLLQAQLLKDETIDEKLKQQLASVDSLILRLRIRQAQPSTSSAEALTLAGKIREEERQRAKLLERMLPSSFEFLIRPVNFQRELFQNMLRERGELAIKFFVGSEQTLVFFLAGDAFETKEIAVGHLRLQKLLTRIHKFITPANNLKTTNVGASFDTNAAFEVYQLLFADWLRGRNATRLAVVPDDVLHALPFDLLVTTAPEKTPQFLLEKFVIRNGISFASLQQAPQTVWRVESVVMLADPILQPAEDSVAQRGGEVFPPVGKEELAAVQKVIRIDHELKQGEANKKKLLPLLLTSDWLHFASHSVSYSREPLFGELILAIPPKQNQPERTYAFEIFKMQLHTRLAILSGCETARGNFFNGEGFEGFVQAFRAAGTPSVIASLWKVEDKATAEFFKHYYAALRQNESTSNALRSAKLKMLADNRFSVLDWASFNYYGLDWNAQLPVPKTSAYLMLIMLIIFIAGSLFIYYYFMRRHARGTSR